MSPEHGKNERDSLRAQLRFHRVLNVGLVATVSLLTILAGYSLTRDRTLIVPPEIKRPYQLGSGVASDDYLHDMAEYVLGMVLTVTPETVGHNNSVILKMSEPSGYPTLKTVLDAAALRLRKERVTTIWVPQEAKVSNREKRVTVKGRLKTYIADKLTSERPKEFTVEFSVTTSNRLWLRGIEEVVGRDGPGSAAAVAGAFDV